MKTQLVLFLWLALHYLIDSDIQTDSEVVIKDLIGILAVTDL